MERKQVYELIDGERAYQQAQGKPDERYLPGWLTSIGYYLDYAEDAREASDRAEVLANIRKIAALAVAALEQYGCPPREGYEHPAPSEAMVGADGLVVKEYLLQEYGMDTDEVTLTRMVQHDNAVKWAIQRNSSALNRNGEWEYQPSPSGRDDEFLARCRFDSIDEALAHWRATLQRRPDAGEGV